jgi:integrase/recombinase XerD
MQPDKNLIVDSFVIYLKKNRFSAQSVKAYKCIIEKFLSVNPNGCFSTYNEILSYLEYLNGLGISKATKQGKLTALKKFFDFLVETEQRDDHPCKTIYVKTSSKRNVIQADLFTMAELESLLEREERFPHLKLKNQVVISLLIYQGLLPGEIVDLKLHHIDLDLGTVYVNSGRLLTARRLPLMDYQINLIDEYIRHHRPRLLLKEKQEYLIVNYHGLQEKVDGINYLMETFRDRFIGRKFNSKAIRDSVISHWMNVKRMPPEQVQLLAGHRWISSTLRYKKAPVDQERELLNRFFPI